MIFHVFLEIHGISWHLLCSENVINGIGSGLAGDHGVDGAVGPKQKLMTTQSVDSALNTALTALSVSMVPIAIDTANMNGSGPSGVNEQKEASTQFLDPSAPPTPYKLNQNALTPPPPKSKKVHRRRRSEQILSKMESQKKSIWQRRMERVHSEIAAKKRKFKKRRKSKKSKRRKKDAESLRTKKEKALSMKALSPPLLNSFDENELNMLTLTRSLSADNDPDRPLSHHELLMLGSMGQSEEVALSRSRGPSLDVPIPRSRANSMEKGRSRFVCLWFGDLVEYQFTF